MAVRAPALVFATLALLATAPAALATDAEVQQAFNADAQKLSDALGKLERAKTKWETKGFKEKHFKKYEKALRAVKRVNRGTRTAVEDAQPSTDAGARAKEEALSAVKGFARGLNLSGAAATSAQKASRAYKDRRREAGDKHVARSRRQSNRAQKAFKRSAAAAKRAEDHFDSVGL